MRKAILRLATKHDYTFNENKITFQSNDSSQILFIIIPKVTLAKRTLLFHRFFE